MTVAELRERMVRWLASDYNAVIFLVSDCDAGYALFRETDDGIYLRQLFVTRDQRGKGFGTEMLRLLRSDFWPAGQRVTVSVLAVNPEALEFHRHAGFVDYCVTLEAFTPEWP